MGLVNTTSTFEAFRPFRHTSFAAIWVATVASNVGGWMYSAASGWLMSDLGAEPIRVALVQAAAALPMFLFAVPSGALADIMDKRRLLLIGEVCITITATLFALIVWLGLATPT